MLNLRQPQLMNEEAEVWCGRESNGRLGSTTFTDLSCCRAMVFCILFVLVDMLVTAHTFTKETMLEREKKIGGMVVGFLPA